MTVLSMPNITKLIGEHFRLSNGEWRDVPVMMPEDPIIRAIILNERVKLHCKRFIQHIPEKRIVE